ncbi:hypothetical protein DSL72_003274 [Monilinia vaccinii-corymbosi]|uniref:ATP-dependent RNA helicase SUV3, mitochondrial n=1 Tax=Monilinia vaccinii-corymbosi TaxID=61207 RepID=A0A8A3P7R2_9HELO|nr:hypothetical protein DSL72_003274 [Monilinia vaccinii-corymbosi]
MTFISRRSGQCAFCALRSLIWLKSSLPKLNGRTFHQSSPVARSNPKPKSRKKYSLQLSDKGSNHHAEHSHRESRTDTDGRAKTGFQEFENKLLKEAKSMKTDILSGHVHMRPLGDADWKGWGLSSREEFKMKFEDFKREVAAAARRATERGEIDEISNPLFCRLKDAYISKNNRGLRDEILYSFTSFTLSGRFSKEDLANHKRLADFRFPMEWYPATRAMHRTFHLHVGPTNSGKTYNALQKLEGAQSGIYAGPLRLLAHEVYTRLNAKGKTCSLITGEERRVPEGAKDRMKSCTVEMVPLNSKVDVAVIDEIQMIGDEHRGWAWTQAVLGVQANEVHLCGELRTTDLIKHLCAMMGDKLVIHKYERLGKLEVMKHCLEAGLRGESGHAAAIKKLEKGDAVILFSRMKIHAMKNSIEARHKGKRCAIIYGSLPPETRALQAALFNDPNNEYDFLVASNAIGMGLNLSIKRVILESVERFDGTDVITLPLSEIKQIAGRAGRYKTANDAIKAGPIDVTDGTPATSTQPPVGLVTTFSYSAHKVLSRAMSREAAQMTSAGIFPPAHVIERFAGYFPKATPFSYTLLRLHDIGSLSSHFHICTLQDQTKISDIIQDFDLPIRMRLIFMAAPASLQDPGFREVLRAFARCVAENTGGHILDIPEVELEILDEDLDKIDGVLERQKYAHRIESLHKVITLYLWLSYRFTGVFYSQALAFHIKGLVEDKIDLCLAKAEWQERARKKAERNYESLMALDTKRMPKEYSVNAASENGSLVGEVTKDVEESPNSEMMLDDQASKNIETSANVETDRILN